MSLARDSSANATGTTTSLSFSHTCSGNNGILFVGVADFQGSSVTGVTYAGVSMTQVAVTSGSGGALTKARLYMLLNPALGANNVVVSISPSNQVSAVSVSYNNAFEGTQPDSTASNQDPGPGNVTTLTQSTTVVKNNCWVVMVGTDDNGGSLTAGSGSTKVTDSTAGCAMFDSNGVVPTGSYSMTYTGVMGHFQMGMASFSPSMGNFLLFF